MKDLASVALSKETVMKRLSALSLLSESSDDSSVRNKSVLVYSGEAFIPVNTPENTGLPPRSSSRQARSSSKQARPSDFIISDIENPQMAQNSIDTVNPSKIFIDFNHDFDAADLSTHLSTILAAIDFENYTLDKSKIARQNDSKDNAEFDSSIILRALNGYDQE